MGSTRAFVEDFSLQHQARIEDLLESRGNVPHSVLFFREGRLVAMAEPDWMPEEGPDQTIVGLCGVAVALKADGVVTVFDGYVSEAPDGKDAYQELPVSKRPGRLEALFIDGAVFPGERFSRLVIYRRDENDWPVLDRAASAERAEQRRAAGLGDEHSSIPDRLLDIVSEGPMRQGNEDLAGVMAGALLAVQGCIVLLFVDDDGNFVQTTCVDHDLMQAASELLKEREQNASGVPG